MTLTDRTWEEQVEIECMQACLEAVSLAQQHLSVATGAQEKFSKKFAALARQEVQFWAKRVDEGMDFGNASLMALNGCFFAAMAIATEAEVDTSAMSPSEVRAYYATACRHWDAYSFLERLHDSSQEVVKK